MYRIPLPEKAMLLMVARLLGKVIDFRFVVFEKACCSSSARFELGAKVTEVSAEDSQKAP
jgi:hypothetical protein